MENTKVMYTITQQGEKGSFVARLVVYKDFIESNGKWRLFWEDINNLGCGFQDESTVMGKPFFNAMHSAIAKGESKYGIKAIRADF
jgi:hypothetical protein